MATPEQVKAAANKIKDACKELSRLKGWSGFQGMLKCVPKVVEDVEAAGQVLGIKGADKKRLAIDIICGLVPDSWVPDWVLAPILSWAIDKAVVALKAKLAKKP